MESLILSAIELSFSTIFFVVFILITYLVTRRSKRASKGWLLVASLISASIATLVDLIVAACGLRDSCDDDAAGFVTAQWFKGLAKFSLMATIMIPVCGRVKARSRPGIIHTLLVGVLAILWICTLSIDSELTVSYSDNLRVRYVLIPLRKAVAVFSVLIASFGMLQALARRMHLRNRVARTTIPLLVCFQLGNTVLELIYPFVPLFPVTLPYTTLDTPELASLISINFLSHLFPAGAIVCAWYVMSSPEISVELVYTPALPSPSVNISEEPSMEGLDLALTRPAGPRSRTSTRISQGHPQRLL